MSLETFERLPADRKELIISTGIEEFSRKAYKDSSTDEITRKCGISKGILFHYFGSKREYYLYCLARALECLTANTEKTDEDRKDDFYGILFAGSIWKRCAWSIWHHATLLRRSLTRKRN